MRVLEVRPGRIELERLHPVAPTAAAAEDLGRALAATHAAGAPHHACGPPGVTGGGWIGRAPLPFADADLPAAAATARFRWRPYLDALDGSGRADVEALVERAGRDPDLLGPTDRVARLHGDLWSGNVVWTAAGAVLVDPAAQGGHPETDLAMLALFGLPHLDRVLAAYVEVAPLADGWRERVALHQLHPLLVHAHLFGGGYRAQAAAVARRYR